jgi:hypothetical protein
VRANAPPPAQEPADRDDRHAAGMAASLDSSGAELEGDEPDRARKFGAMPESQREAIRRAMQSRGPITEEHRRCASAGSW